MAPATQSTQPDVFRYLIAALTAGRRGARASAIIAIAAIAAVASGAAYIGAVRTMYYGHDIVPMLNGAWRVVCGQKPHIDFYSAWGPLPFIVYGVGLILARNSVIGFGYGLAILSLVFGLAAWIVCRKRMFPAVAVLTSTAVALLTAAPFPVGFKFTVLTHAMSYNRFGYALVAIVLLECFTEPQGKTDMRIGGLIAGASCMAALFDKASYFPVALTFIVASLVFSRARTRLLSIGIGAAVVALVFLAYLDFRVYDMIADLSIAGKARSEGMSPWGLKWAIFDAVRYSLPLLAGALLLLMNPWRASARPLARYAPVLVTLLAVFDGALLLFSNAQNYGFPTVTIASLLICNWALERAVADRRERSYYCAVVVIATVSFLPGFTGDALGIVYGLVQTARPVPAGVEYLKQPHLSKLILVDVRDARDWEERSNGKVYVEYINDAVDLLRKYSKPTETVMDFDIHDPLSYALLRRPAKGGFIAMGIDNSYSDDSKPSAQRLFGDVDIVMYPKYPSASDVHFSGLNRNYGAALHDLFERCAESGRWIMYRRRNTTAACGNSNDTSRIAVH